MRVRARAKRKKAVETLRESEVRYRTLLEHSPDAIVIAKEDGKIVLVNEQAEKLFGYSREELLGEPVEILMPERFRSTHHGHRAGYASAPRVRPMGAASNCTVCARMAVSFRLRSVSARLRPLKV